MNNMLIKGYKIGNNQLIFQSFKIARYLVRYFKTEKKQKINQKCDNAICNQNYTKNNL